MPGFGRCDKAGFVREYCWCRTVPGVFLILFFPNMFSNVTFPTICILELLPPFYRGEFCIKSIVSTKTENV